MQHPTHPPDAKITAIQAMSLNANLELQLWLFAGVVIILGMLLSSSFSLSLDPIAIELQADSMAVLAETSGTLG